MEKDLESRKQELITGFNSFAETRRDKTEETVWRQLGNFDIRSNSVSQKQLNYVEKLINDFIANEEQSFADNVVDYIGEDKIFDRRRSAQKYYLNFENDFRNYNLSFPTDEIKDIAYEEVVERLIDQTGQSQEMLNKYANDNYLGDLGQINQEVFNSIVEHFNSAEMVEEDNEEFQQIMSLYDNADVIVVINGGNLPPDYHDLPSVAFAYADKNELIDDSIDELMDSQELRFEYSDDKDWLADNNPSLQFDELIFKRWLMDQPIYSIVANAFDNTYPVLMTYDEIFDFYTK